MSARRTSKSRSAARPATSPTPRGWTRATASDVTNRCVRTEASSGLRCRSIRPRRCSRALRLIEPGRARGRGGGPPSDDPPGGATERDPSPPLTRFPTHATADSPASPATRPRPRRARSPSSSPGDARSATTSGRPRASARPATSRPSSPRRSRSPSRCRYADTPLGHGKSPSTTRSTPTSPASSATPARVTPRARASSGDVHGMPRRPPCRTAGTAPPVIDGGTSSTRMRPRSTPTRPATSATRSARSEGWRRRARSAWPATASETDHHAEKECTVCHLQATPDAYRVKLTGTGKGP